MCCVTLPQPVPLSGPPSPQVETRDSNLRPRDKEGFGGGVVNILTLLEKFHGCLYLFFF